jgi:hypothetical protein
MLLLAASTGALLQCGGGGSGPPGETADHGGIDATVDGAGDDGGGNGNDAGTNDAGDAMDGDDGFTVIDAGIPCDASAQCGDSSTAACCSGRCTDTALDPRNCGTCGNACLTTQFCTGTACDDAVFANICGNRMATLVFDKFDPDNDAGAHVGQALIDNCKAPNDAGDDAGPWFIFKQEPNESNVVDPASNRPILGVGDTYLIGGGWFGHVGMAYMDDHGLTAVQVNGDGTNSWIRKLGTDAGIVSVLTTSLTGSHDYFILEMAVEPVSGTLCFAATGMLAPGTAAAAYWAANEVIPNRTTYTDAWYAVQWDDKDEDGEPSAGDSFLILDHGK